ncbi:MAG TPA: hypothetical protein VG963_10750 [Polyangiaceae bacterium]|nr:hypothetical protein [Polyangiaceae bacterium]
MTRIHVTIPSQDSIPLRGMLVELGARQLVVSEVDARKRSSAADVVPGDSSRTVRGRVKIEIVVPDSSVDAIVRALMARPKAVPQYAPAAGSH